MDYLIVLFLIKNNYRNFDINDFKLHLKTHLDYPSFYSITNTLEYFGIENIAAEVPYDSLSDLPKYFLSIISNRGEDEFVLVTQNKSKIQTTDKLGQKKTHSVAEFKKVWKNIVIVVEPNEKFQFSSLFKIATILGFITLISSILILNGNSLITLLLFSLSACGLYLGFLLVREKVGEHSSTISSVCNISEKTDCNAVITSEGAKIFNILDLADATFIFFGSIVVYQLFYEWNTLLTLGLIASIPIVIYSIYYQLVFIKKWCVLCLGVSGILIVLTGISMLNLNYDFLIIDIFRFLLIVGLVATSFYFGKNQYSERKKLQTENISLIKFKRNPELFRYFFSKAEPLDKPELISGEVILGNLNAPNQITVLTNPLCGFCKAAFHSYLKMLQGHRDHIKLVVRFNVGAQHLDHPSTKVSARLIEIFNSAGEENFINSYNVWFDNRDISSWLKHFGEPKCDRSVLDVLEQQQIWGIENKLQYTPATVINGKLYPNNYSYEDFSYLTKYILNL